MTSRRAIKSVVHNFLGTYTSRYSDYAGYWLFGFIVADLQHLRADLLGCEGATPEETPQSMAKRSAAAKFQEQMAKAGLPLSTIHAASLEIEKVPGLVQGIVNGHACDGERVLFRAQVTTDPGTIYQFERSLFVAPHNPRVELRSTRVE